MCGAIRQEFEVYATLAMLCDYRYRGLIEGIVISTWERELEHIPGLRKKLEHLDISVLELEPLDEDMGKFMNLNYARQAFQLKAGLDFIPEDVFVLKCRTDLSERTLKTLEPVLLGEVDLTIGSHGGMPIGLCYKMAVRRLSITRPFAFGDTGFFGYKQDMQKMISFEMTEIKWNLNMIPDVAFFFHMFVNEYPLIYEVLVTLKRHSLFTGELLVERIRERWGTEEMEGEDFVLPGILNKFYALYFILMKNCFYLIEHRNQKLNSFSLTDVFVGNKKLGMVCGNSGFCRSHIKNMEIVRMITEGECKLTKGYTTLYQEICKMAVPGYAKKVCLNRRDYKEMVKWLRDELKLSPKGYLHWKKADSQYPKADFMQSLDILFEDYGLGEGKNKEAFYSLMDQICGDTERGFYNVIADHMQTIQYLGKDLFEIALCAANRSELPRVLKTTAKNLYFGQIDTSRTEAAQFILKRSAGKPNYFYNFPLVSDKISAFYYYGKYSELNGDNTMPRTFYNKLRKTFSLPAEEEPENYSDALLQTIRELVNTRYREYQEDLSLRYLIDFLSEEFPEDSFTPEASEYLAAYRIKRQYTLPFQKGDSQAYVSLLVTGTEVNTRAEAKEVLRLLLREKSGLKTQVLQKEADQAIRQLAERFGLEGSPLVRANEFLSGTVLKPMELEELERTFRDSTEDFLLWLRILARQKCLRINEEILLKLCKEDPVRQIALYLLFWEEADRGVHLFAVKNGSELWMNHIGFCRTGYDGLLKFNENGEGLRWPQAEAASESCFAGWIKTGNGKLVLSIEFSSGNCKAKERLLECLEASEYFGQSEHFKQQECGEKTGLLEFEKEARVIRLKRGKWNISCRDTIPKAVEQAVENFCQVGELLAECAKKQVKI